MDQRLPVRDRFEKLRSTGFPRVRRHRDNLRTNDLPALARWRVLNGRCSTRRKPDSSEEHQLPREHVDVRTDETEFKTLSRASPPGDGGARRIWRSTSSRCWLSRSWYVSTPARFGCRIRELLQTPAAARRRQNPPSTSATRSCALKGRIAESTAATAISRSGTPTRTAWEILFYHISPDAQCPSAFCGKTI